MKETSINHKPQPALELWLDRLITGGILLFLALLPFHLVIKKLVPDPLGTYWKEGLLILLVGLWALRCLLARKVLLSGTSLDLPVLLYAGFILLRLLLDRSGQVGLWGAYISILYLPLFWLVPLALRRYPRLVTGLLIGLTAVGTLVSLGAILEFLLDKPLWPSVELTMRQGYPDMYVYGTHLRRVYFVFDSPTTLANTLAMILPLALVLLIQSRRLWQRLAAAAAAVLLFAAILLTFSRGIWVSLALAAVVVVVIKLITDRKWKFLIRAGLAGLTALVILGLVWVTTPTSKSTVDQYSLELLPAAYQQVPLGGQVISLSDVTPQEGQPEKQVWTIFDPIEQRDDTREVIYTHPKTDAPNQVIYTLTVPENGLLRFSIALSPEVWTPEKGDGVNFKVFIQEKDAAEGQFVFLRYINPKANPNDRRWRNYAVDLSAWGGKQVNLSLIAEAGPASDYGFDWAGWADLDLGSAAEGYVAANWPEPQSPVAEHLASITDWTQDESNRDRLAAWNQGFAAWKLNPIWGNGLGTTGTAALRTQPQTAFVTESQVLKALVEGGIPGLLIWAFLWFSIGRLAWKMFRTAEDDGRKFLALGLMGSLLMVFIDGLVYQNLEVKQVNAYFWTLLGLLAFLSLQRPAAEVAAAAQPAGPLETGEVQEAAPEHATLDEAPSAQSEEPPAG